MKSSKLLGLLLVAAMLTTALAGCGGATPTAAPTAAPTKAPAPTAAPTNPVDSVEIKAPITITFWHTQSAGRETAMKKIAADFTKANPNITVNLEYINGYTDLYKKMMASIQAGALPDLAVSYESMIADYATAKIVVPLDDYVNSTKYGLTKEDLADMPSDMLDICRNPLLGNKLYTFPFTKSLLVMYYNADLLKAAGFDKPPATWDDFIKAAKAVTAGGKAKGYAAAMSASTFHGMILSRGGKLTSADFKAGNRNGPEGLASLQLISDGLKEGWAYYAKGYDWQNDFAAGTVAMALDSTSGLFFVPPLIKTPFNWGVAALPQTPPSNNSILYGANVGIFKSTPEKQLASWLFVKYFASQQATVDWAIASNYFPVRKSAETVPAFKDVLDKNPQYKMAFALFKGGTKMVGEPNVAGEQDARVFVEDPMTGVLTGKLVTAADIKAALDAANKKITEAYVSKAAP
jgi:ABC-type glycerol-3-phosphate transport system substrate-binding protein